MGLQNDVFEGGAVRIVIDAGESLIEPGAEVACKNQLAFTVHSGIACVLVPSLPNRGAAFGDHIAPTGACGAGGDLEGRFGLPTLRERLHEPLHSDQPYREMTLLFDQNVLDQICRAEWHREDEPNSLNNAITNNCS